MVKRKVKCQFGRLASPVRGPSGSIRRCKLKPKTHAGRVADRKTASKESHERRYRRDKRKLARTVKTAERKMARRISSRTTRKKKK